MTQTALLERTPASIGGLEDFQPDRSPMLNYSIFAILIAVALLVALVDVVSALDEGISQTGGIELCLRIWELLFAFGIDQIIEA